jgi:ParB/RepB/Spo0J family partition protein
MTQYETSEIPINAIYVRDGRRELDEGKLTELARSIQNNGMHTPIIVAKRGENRFVLTAGHHRLETAKRLGWLYIPGFVKEGSRRDHRIWEAEENAIRAELTPLRRAEAIEVLVDEYAFRREKEQKGGHQQHDKGISAAARELGMDRDFIRRMLTIARRMFPAAKREALARGVDNNQSHLLEVAALPSESEQIAKVCELANKTRGRRSKQVTSRDLPRRRRPRQRCEELSLREQRHLRRLQRIYQSAMQRTWIRASSAVRGEFISQALDQAPVWLTPSTSPALQGSSEDAVALLGGSEPRFRDEPTDLLKEETVMTTSTQVEAESNAGEEW